MAIRGTAASKAERKRRAAQSAKDKQLAKSGKPTGPRKISTGGSARKSTGSGGKGKGGGIHPYTKLILDPCHAALTSAPLPGRSGGIAFRLPFRQIVQTPTGGAYVSGAAGSAQNWSALAVTLVPNALLALGATSGGTNIGGASAISVCSTGNESGAPWSSTFLNTSNNKAMFTLDFDPQGLAQLDTLSSLVRPIAGCIKMEFYAGTSNTGNYFGYEGQVGNSFFQYQPTPSTYGSFYPAVTMSQIAMSGWSNGIVTEGVQAAVNYAAAASPWQEFQPVGQASAQADLAGVPYADMPIACVGVGGSVPGTQYLISGAIVYEWIPSLSFAPGASSAPPAPQQPSVLSKVVTQLANYGPMLVGVASKLAAGGPSLALSDLFYRMSMNRFNGGMGNNNGLRITGG